MKKEKNSKKDKSEKKGKVITQDMTFMEVMEMKPEAAYTLMEMGMMCGGCPMAQFETIEDGCNAHGTDVKDVMKKINEAGEGKKNE
jgi:hybrid cluster-associated redox disulfide protein